MPPTLRELLQRATTNRGGGPDLIGVSTAFRSHGSFVFRVLASFGVDAQARDDCVQEVFIIALRRWDRYDQSTSLRSWLFGIARRVAADYRRARGRRAVREQRGLPPQTRPGADDAVASRQAAAFVRRFCAELEDRLRDVFVAMELEHMTATETAQSLGVNVNTVYTRLRRARQLFVRAVEQNRTRNPGTDAIG
jgi:RNA polymerase sigma-70 factor (ECF subfamily)